MNCSICKNHAQRFIVNPVKCLGNESNRTFVECIPCALKRYKCLKKAEKEWKDGEYINEEGVAVKIERPSHKLRCALKTAIEDAKKL